VNLLYREASGTLLKERKKKEGKKKGVRKKEGVKEGRYES